MTRSDNPFGDLPEWKERQRLQEAQEQAGSQPRGFQQSNQYGHPPAQQHALGQGHGDGGSLQHAPDAERYYQEPTSASSQLHYNVPTNGLQVNHGGYEPHLAQPTTTYDPQTQVTYPADPNAQHLQSYANPGQAPADYGAVGQMEPRPDGGYGLREGYYDDNGQYHAVGPSAPHAPGYDPSNFAPGQPTWGPDSGSAYYDPAGGSGEHWHAGQAGVAAAPQASLGYNDESDEDDYYDDDMDDETQRYSWKMLAAVVVTGAVVTGGGVVLYDSFTSGGLGNSGKAPIIRADQGPAKTAPVDAGGRKFGNRDSKLLGRLDNADGSKTSSQIDSETESGNRVRSVPTVRIGRDGRLILPKAPEAVKAPMPAAGGNQVAAVSGERIAPGFNVVDSLNGGSISGLGLGSLPRVQPKAEEPAVEPASLVPTRQAASQVKRLNSQPVTAAAKKSSPTNRAIAPKDGPPPVPSKSSLGSAWRMTGTAAAAQKQPAVGGIRPTIAQPVQLTRQVRAPRPSASTLGAANLAPAKNRKFVAVLATAPTRMKALQSFAELQQKHPNALLNRVPDVRKTDLSARGLGIMYRVIVGPAGSRSSASSVCTSLKSEGYAGCWVKNN